MPQIRNYEDRNMRDEFALEYVRIQLQVLGECDRDSFLTLMNALPNLTWEFADAMTKARGLRGQDIDCEEIRRRFETAMAIPDPEPEGQDTISRVWDMILKLVEDVRYG